jgi:Flp pilus assembly protein CpaB
MVDKDLLVGADFIGSRSEAIGLAPKTGLVKGQRLKKVELEVSGLTNDIAPGKRGVTLSVDKLQTAGGLLRDSDYIDLIFSTKVNLTYIFPTRPYEVETATGGDGTASGQTVTLPAQSPSDPSAYVFPGEAGSRFKIQGEKKGDPLAKVVLQDIKVLRVVVAAPPAQGQQQQPTAAQSDMIILEMSADQAEVMKFILDNGASYSFAVRGKDDHTTADTKGITYDLFVSNYHLPMPKSVRLPGEKQP